jgi:hypothetical protein
MLEWNVFNVMLEWNKMRDGIRHDRHWIATVERMCNDSYRDDVCNCDRAIIY